MSTQTDSEDLYFNPLNSSSELPERFNLMKDGEPHPLCVDAVKQLKLYLSTQKDWEHNFGLKPKQKGRIIGKMFGVLVVQNSKKQIGYLAAFSGKLAGGNHHPKFVPPVFDSLQENSFLNNGMAELKRLNEEILNEEALMSYDYKSKIINLKIRRKIHSNILQNELFNHYCFLNPKGELKSLLEIFRLASYKNPPSGAGECAGPKLLQFAYLNQMKPLALAEFWWGQSPKSDQWKHENYYSCCKEKCEPILSHMLVGIDFDL